MRNECSEAIHCISVLCCEVKGTLDSTLQSLFVRLQAAVGGGLPIITTLQDALFTGDEVYSIKGTLSGTLSHLFNTFGPGQSFAQLVKDARAQGFTEPDPREDLCGMFVCTHLNQTSET